MSKSRCRRKRAVYRQKPGNELSIEQLKAIARYCGYETRNYSVCVDLVDNRTSYIVARGDIALNHLRSLYVERDIRRRHHSGSSPLREVAYALDVFGPGSYLRRANPSNRFDGTNARQP